MRSTDTPRLASTCHFRNSDARSLVLSWEQAGRLRRMIDGPSQAVRGMAVTTVAGATVKTPDMVFARVSAIWVISGEYSVTSANQ